MADDKKKKITDALDKMESEFSLRARENDKIRTSDKKVYKKETEVQKATQIKKIQGQKEQQKYEFRSRTTQIVLLLVLSIGVGFNLTSVQRTTFIDYSIYTILVVGIVCAKKKS
jgi:hypothetical protein